MLTDEDARQFGERLFKEYPEKMESIFKTAYDLGYQSADIVTSHIDSALRDIDNANLIQAITLKELIYLLNCTLYAIMAKQRIPPDTIFRFMEEDIKRAREKVTELLTDIDEAQNDG